MNKNSTDDKLKDICIRYFSNFSKKDLSKLKNDFSEDIILRDWEIEENGLESVIRVISTIFEKNYSINIKVINLIRENHQVAAEIEILINEEELIKVVDIIKFNNQNKIYSITAYKG